LVLVPGETHFPGSGSGKVGSTVTQTADASFMVTVLAVDDQYYLDTWMNTTVTLATSDPDDVHPAAVSMVAGLANFTLTLKTAGGASVTGVSASLGMTATAGLTVVGSAVVASKLLLLLPGETHAPGTANGKTGYPEAHPTGISWYFTVLATDDQWNRVTTAANMVSLAATTDAWTHQEPAAMVNGSLLAWAQFNAIGTFTLSSGDTGGTLAPIPTGVDIGGRFVLVLPGETVAWGSAPGKTGSPIAQTPGQGFQVTIYPVDNQYRRIGSFAQNANLNSSDVNAFLPASWSINFSSGVAAVGVTLNTTGSQTLTVGEAGGFQAASQTVTESVGTVTVAAALARAAVQSVSVPFTVAGTAGNPADHRF
jgi:hypothetical protein